MKKIIYILVGTMAFLGSACSNSEVDELVQSVQQEQQMSNSRVELVTASVTLDATNRLKAQLAAELTDPSTVQKLTITGEFQADDGNFMKSLEKLQEVDMTGVTIKQGYVTDRGDGTGMVIYSQEDNLMPDLFRGNTVLTSIKLPASIKKISSCAFENCTSLGSVEIPSKVEGVYSGVEEIYWAAFRGCNALTTIVIPSSVTYMEGYIFDSNESLTTVKFQANVTSVPYGMFSNCNQLVNVELPSTITVIEESAFSSCTALTTINLPAALIKIGRYAFNNTGLTEISIPNSVTTIEEGAFNNTKFKTLTIPSTVTTTTGGIVDGCENLITLFWNSLADVFDRQWGIGENCYLYITSVGGNTAQYGPNWVNVIVDGKADKIVLSSNRNNGNSSAFFCPQSFIAKEITYTREFNSWSWYDYKDKAHGWQTIVLPFVPTKVSHAEKGLLAPFNSGVENSKPFWLRKLTNEGFVDVTAMEANVPFIISMPNSNEYLEEYNITGEVTFTGENVTVVATPNPLSVVAGPNFDFHPTYSRIEKSSSIYVLNYQYNINGYNEGGVFAHSIKEVNPFECYVTTKVGSKAVIDINAAAKSRALVEKNTSGIPRITDM